jgi:hypothetical protein
MTQMTQIIKVLTVLTTLAGASPANADVIFTGTATHG